LVTSANAAGAKKLEHLPHLDGVLRTDDEALSAASARVSSLTPVVRGALCWRRR
jgi:hypothetical protein